MVRCSPHHSHISFTDDRLRVSRRFSCPISGLFFTEPWVVNKRWLLSLLNMRSQIPSSLYNIGVIGLGALAVAISLIYFPLASIDPPYYVIAGLTIALGSRVTLRIPRFNSHISVSDTFIFLSLLLYGPPVAVVFAAVEAFFASRRFCVRWSSILFNSATMAASTGAVALVLALSGLHAEDQLHGHPGFFADFVLTLSLLALMQFAINTAFAATYDSINNSLPFVEIWKTKYLWTFYSYFIGAISAGLLVQLADNWGVAIVAAAIPVMLFVFLTYRMYLTNVEISAKQAEQAEEYAKLLEEQSEALRHSEELFRSAFNHAPIGMALVAPDGRWLRVNRVLTSILGYSEREFLRTDFQSLIAEPDLGSALVRIHELAVGRINTCQMERRFLHKNGNTVWTLWCVSSASEHNVEGSNLIFQIQDITDKKISEQKLLHEATHDPLTGLPNRALFMDRLSAALKTRIGKPDHSVSVLFIDLDRFKYVNDSLGHLAGDRLLVDISRRLKECLRPNDSIARLGGDEFTILVEGDHDPGEITRIADRIHGKFATPFHLERHLVYSSASIGILHASENHTNAEEMMRDADTAMYHAKRGGKARHEVFDENMHKAAKEALRLETDFRRAVEDGEFEIKYQPIFSLSKGKVTGIEALARWDHPEFGAISPERFVPLAEEIGWIDAFGELILRKACGEVCKFFAADEDRDEMTLSVNLSCRQFASQDLVKRIGGILVETGFNPHRLKLEITESVLFAYHENALGMLDELRTLGVEVEIDDFGTGYSNLSYLARLPISSLKIDRSFVSPIDETHANTEIVRTILTLADNLGLNVVAEGIETEAQLEALRVLGCERGQGFYLARPMRLAELSEFLRDNPSRIFETAENYTPISMLPTIQ